MPAVAAMSWIRCSVASQPVAKLRQFLSEGKSDEQVLAAFVDAGLRRTPRLDPGSGMSRLETVAISRASADQRRGRAGRIAPGVCYRLWSESAHASLSAQIAAKTALRQYWAVVKGHMPTPEGRVDAPIARHPVHRKKFSSKVSYN